MRLIAVAIYDRAVDAYMRPWFVKAVGEAVRAFQDEVCNKESPMFKHPDDYDLFELGAWDDGDGRFEVLPEPRQLAIGKQMVVNLGV